MHLIEVDWGTQRIVNMFLAWRKELIRILKRLGMQSLTELVGRTECLLHLDYMSRTGSLEEPRENT
jgi:glutamate synthase domain-containing protein 2